MSPRSLLLSLLVWASILVPGCVTPGTGPGTGESTLPTASGLPPTVPPPPQEPTVRVRIARARSQIEISAPARLRVTCYAAGLASTPQPLDLPAPLRISRRDGRFVLDSSGAGAARSALAVNWPGLLIEPLSTYRAAPALRLEGVDYPQRVALYPAADNPAAVDAINLVSLEAYLPGVLTKELYPDWQPEMFRAQAVAARSYAIYESMCSRDQRFDLEAGQASQAYIGLAASPKALAAAQATRGQVVTWLSGVFPAYYSSASGGLGQDAVLAFPDGPDIPPLRGRVQGTWSAASPFYLWAIQRSRADLLARFQAWGRANRHPLADIRSLRDLAVTACNAAGRPAVFTVTDHAGRRWQLGPEEFRFAANFAPAALPLPAAALLRSSYVEIRLTPTAVQFVGHGFGHGVGLCQYGAQAMAARGYNYQSILAFYYPGSALRQAY